VELAGIQESKFSQDASRKSDVENMVEKVMDQFRAIDILVNNSGTESGRTALLPA